MFIGGEEMQELKPARGRVYTMLIGGQLFPGDSNLVAESLKISGYEVLETTEKEIVYRDPGNTQAKPIKKV